MIVRVIALVMLMQVLPGNLGEHFQTRWTWDESVGADHYWFCITDDPQDFTVPLIETEAWCAPVLSGLEYTHYGGFFGRWQSDMYYYSVVACSWENGCSGFRN